MNRKVFNLVSTLIGATQAVSAAVVTYISPEHAVEINSSIVIVSTASIKVHSQFIKN